MLKIIVDREDNTQIFNITQEMWYSGSSASKFSGGITIKIFGNSIIKNDGTWIPVSNISSSKVTDFILNIDNYIKENKKVIFRDTKIDILDGDDEK